jgi:hypothetical protein
MRMIQRGDRVRLALGSFAELSGGDFDRHIALQARIMSLVDLTHATSTQGSEDLVRTEFFAG